ncbi:MAG: exodeoxyribonuclease I [Acidiferrobacterales bacterium]|nr:exodeoxyribonuclease I [Acidiferrobacterales bacterium]
MTFFWHDYETFGINPARDRPSQFAGVRTDFEFNVIGDPVTIYCKPARDILPSPMACLITGITPQLAQEKGVIESEFIARIHQEMSVRDTCSLGYNSLRFDDEVTRYTLYRNFFDPYAREWQNGCSRWDIIDLVRMTYALRPEGIEWPVNDQGVASFRLEQLTEANGISHESAHDALSDVYATIALAKLIKSIQPKLFDWLFEHRGKNKVLELLNVRGQKPFLHTTRMYLAEHACTSLVVPLGFEARNKSSLLVYDLRHSPEEFFDLDVPALRDRIFTSKDDLPEDTIRLPVKSLKINKCPAIAPVSALTDEIASRIKINPDLCAKHREQLLNRPGFIEDLRTAYEGNTYPRNADVDQGLYDGFFGEGDKSKITQVRESTANELSDASYQFVDPRLEELLFRYRARNWPDSLAKDEKVEWNEHCMRRYQDEDHGLQPYFEELSALRHEHASDSRACQIIDALERWGDDLL